MEDLPGAVEAELRATGATDTVLGLWKEIADAYVSGGPMAVKGLVEGKVRGIRRSGGRQVTGERTAGAEAGGQEEVRST